MFNKRQEKRINLIGETPITINMLPRTTRAQQEIKFKQNLKKNYGGLTEQTIKYKNLNQQNYLKNVLLSLNVVKTIFHAQHLIKGKNILINNKIIIAPNYQVKPFSTIAIKTPYKELTLLNLIKTKGLKKNNNFINSNYFYKTNKFNLNPILKKFIH